MAKFVTIITGFLGAGKTSFLNEVIAEKSNIKFAIIENEFGAESIDNELIIKPDDSIIEMNNGCLCCTLNDNLYDILNELKQREKDFDQLIIETTGIADPAGVAGPLFNYADIKKEFPVARVVCLVDVALIADQLKDTEEAIKQIVFSDIIVLNKTQSVTPTYLLEIKDLMLKLNPFAKIFIENEKQFQVLEIFETTRDEDFKTNNKVTNVELQHSHHHHHHGDITSLSFVFDEPFNEKELQMRLFAYLLFEAKDLYRIKGIIQGKALNHRLILQSVGQSLSITGGRNWDENEPKQSRIVFIGKKLEESFFRNLLGECLA
jgi:G3E family GTPase